MILDSVGSVIMSKFSMLGATMGVAFAAVAMAAPAQAVITTTFAQFVQQSTSAKMFKYVNVNNATPTKATFTSSGNNTVLLSNIGSLASPSLAKVTFSATATALPTFGTLTTTQLFSGTLTFTLLSPQLGLSGPSVNALKVTFTDAALKAEPGTSAPTLQADTEAGATISYSSDFEDLSVFTSQNFSLSFSGASKALTPVAGRLPNFNASATGTFAGAAAVPEPASWAMMLCGFGAMGAVMRGRRKTAVIFN
jgi:hypothetical protein